MHAQLFAGALALALGLGTGLTTASAFTPLGPDEAKDPAVNGERLLGVDIGDVDLSTAGVHGFLATLTPQGQQGVLAACQNIGSLGAASQVNARDAVLLFCDIATGGTAAPVGYTPGYGLFGSYPAAGSPG